MYKYKKITRICILIFSIFVFNLNYSVAQNQTLSLQNIAKIKVDELSDNEIAEFWEKIQNSGITLTQLEKEAKNRNVPADEIIKLKERINNLPINTPNKSKAVKTGERKNSSKTPGNETFEKEDSKIFGAELFSNKNLTFEPNMKMATPQNYQIGPDDELIIDIYGYSEETMNLNVSPDGNIRIPLAGIVQVSGLTIEQAKVKIIRALSQIYERINTGETKVNITLGNIRSIKVLIVGEVNLPGTYTLPSLATVFNALYASGGPNKNGSMRNIKVIRNNKVIVTLDIYDFMLKAEAKGNIRLQDQDIIKINPYENKISIKGEVKREGFFEVQKNETLNDVINFAGGFTNDAFKERIKVTRNTSKQKSVADIQQELFGMFNPKSGDEFQVDKLLNRYENRVIINGAVFRPGTYALENGLTVLKLINKAEGLKEDAFTTRAIIYRLKDDNSLTMLSINLIDAKEGKIPDILLQREDIIQIASKLDLKEGYNVTINGQVINPGSFSYAQNMKIEDLIIAAGGFKDAASYSRVEVSRRKFDVDKTKTNTEIAIVKQFDLDKDLKDNASLKFELEPFDIVNVFTQPGYEPQKNVSIEGEVLFPGKYTIEKNNEHISDLLKRSGGLTASGFADGIVLLRQKNKNVVENIIKANKLRALQKQSKDTADVNDQILNSENEDYDIVGIDVTKILKKPGSKADLILREGDILRVPYEKQTVLVSGEVLYPVKVNINNASGLRGFVTNAGGFSSKALKRKSYVVYANGTVKATKNFLVFNLYPKIKPGCEIIVPKKEFKKGISMSEITAITTSLSTLVFLIVTISNISKP
jgi:protein involved in polysaccharide export with SLBB domain